MDKTHGYIKKICSEDLSLLTNDEIVELFVKYHNGDVTAKETLIKSNLMLVAHAMHILNVPYEDIDDLFQVGCIGLIKAVNKFDLSYSNKFSTFAIPMIIGEIRRHRRDDQIFGGMSKKVELISKINSIKVSLENKLGREPSLNEISKSLGISKKIIEEALIVSQRPVSLYTVINDYSDGKEIFLLDAIPDEAINSDKWDSEIVTNTAIKGLSAEEKKIAYCRYVLGQTQTEVAKMMGCSQMTISRSDKGIRSELKKHIKY